jgi:hypothetical protein
VIRIRSKQRSVDRKEWKIGAPSHKAGAPVSSFSLVGEEIEAFKYEPTKKESIMSSETIPQTSAPCCDSSVCGIDNERLHEKSEDASGDLAQGRPQASDRELKR